MYKDDIDFIIYTYNDFNIIYVSLKMLCYHNNIIFCCFNNLKSHKHKTKVLRVGTYIIFQP